MMAWSTRNPSSGTGRMKRSTGPFLVAAKTIPDNSRHSSPANRVASLKKYRHAKGLCAGCVEKWFSSRKCAATTQQPQLHAMEEVWNLVAEEYVIAPDAESIEAPVDQLFKNLSHSAWLGSENQSDSISSHIVGTLKQGYPLLQYEDAIPTRLSLVAW
jgi:hypothetical protein